MPSGPDREKAGEENGRAARRQRPGVSGLAGLCLFLSTSLYGQSAMHVTHLTVKQGLSQGDVMCTFQDGEGFMWFGTQDGLNRFDGYSFTVFRHDPADPHTLDDSWIVSIAETPDGVLWVGTGGGSRTLNRFDRITETFTRVPLDSVDLTRARVSALRSVFVDAFGNRWSGPGAIGGGLSCFDPARGTTKLYRHDPSDPNTLCDDRVYSVYGDRRGRIWVATHEGLGCLNRETGAFVHYTHDDRDLASLSDNWVWPMIEDGSGMLWVGTFRGGLNRLDPSTGKFTHFMHDESDPRSLGDNRIYSLYQDRSGIIWVGTGEHGVDRFQPEHAPFVRVAHENSNPESLLNDNVLSMFVDRSGVPWIGTRAGLDRFDRRTFTFTHYTHDPSKGGALRTTRSRASLRTAPACSGSEPSATASTGLTGRVRSSRISGMTPRTFEA